MSDDAVIVGRFQPFHHGHRINMIEYAQQEYDEVYLGIGVDPDGRTGRNPLTYGEREDVIDELYPDLPTFPVEEDTDPGSWVDNIEDGLDGYREDHEVTPVTGNTTSRDSFEQEGYDVDFREEDDLVGDDVYRGTRIRERARDGGEWRHLVPDDAAAKLDEIGFEERVRQHD
ncbi:MAG: adenylyltransferase/cytidyltransferase family protein [Candidatus Nanohaloarchaea archaeon]|nr:adenylyltransferase/cytidyltransferase family protein [Candidatus Nanohaloarchaea archaeon]